MLPAPAGIVSDWLELFDNYASIECEHIGFLLELVQCGCLLCVGVVV